MSRRLRSGWNIASTRRLPSKVITLHGTASFGVALYPEDGTTRDSLLNAADAAMYAAKIQKTTDRNTSGEASAPDHADRWSTGCLAGLRGSRYSAGFGRHVLRCLA